MIRNSHAAFLGEGRAARLEPYPLTSNPQAIKQILSSDTKQFSAPGELNKILASLLGYTPIFMLDGDRHRQMAFSFMFFPSLQKDLGPWSPWGYLQRLQRQIDELIYSEIRDRRQENNLDRTDILSLLMAARDEEGKSLTDLELRDELMTLLFAGHETTASAMAWALYWIHYLPEVREKLLSELDTLGEIPDTMSILKLPYLAAVCNETLRIYPVGILTFARSAKEPIELMGYHLEPGAELGICIYLTHQREDIYPEPKQFKPERFLDRQFSPYEFLPFGGGARRCIGEALAQLEMKVVLATILCNYKLKLVDKRPIAPQRRGIILSPRGGVKMFITS